MDELIKKEKELETECYSKEFALTTRKFKSFTCSTTNFTKSVIHTVLLPSNTVMISIYHGDFEVGRVPEIGLTMFDLYNIRVNSKVGSLFDKYGRFILPDYVTTELAIKFVKWINKLVNLESERKEEWPKFNLHETITMFRLFDYFQMNDEMFNRVSRTLNNWDLGFDSKYKLLFLFELFNMTCYESLANLGNKIFQSITHNDLEYIFTKSEIPSKIITCYQIRNYYIDYLKRCEKPEVEKAAQMISIVKRLPGTECKITLRGLEDLSAAILWITIDDYKYAESFIDAVHNINPDYANIISQHRRIRYVRLPDGSTKHCLGIKSQKHNLRQYPIGSLRERIDNHYIINLEYSTARKIIQGVDFFVHMKGQQYMLRHFTKHEKKIQIQFTIENGKTMQNVNNQYVESPVNRRTFTFCSKSMDPVSFNYYRRCKRKGHDYDLSDDESDNISRNKAFFFYKLDNRKPIKILIHDIKYID